MTACCAVCLESVPRFVTKNRVRLGCGHVFHKPCIKTWYRGSIFGNTCPCCRSPIRFEGISYLYNVLILRFWYFTKPVTEWNEIHDGYIYYDNAGLLLYVNDVKICGKHFGTWWLNQLRK
jgi:hypothetical protein